MPDYDPALDLLAPADALAVRLAAVPELAGVACLVARQMDIETEIATAVAAASGAAVLIALDGWSPADADSDDVGLVLELRVGLFTDPLMRPDAVPEAVALGAMIAAISGWYEAGEAAEYRWRVGAGGYVQAPLESAMSAYRIYEFAVTREIYLPLYVPPEED